MLFMATLLHDMGMLSQRAEDLPLDARDSDQKGRWTSIAGWARATHCTRLLGLTRRVLKDAGHDDFGQSETCEVCVAIGGAHGKWPWQWEGRWQEEPRHRGLAAAVAVADLLDEDGSRCDTRTLLRHREGTDLNRAHWIRHALTANRVIVDKGNVSVGFARPPETGSILDPVFSALRNHFRLVCLYEEELQTLSAGIDRLCLDPCTGHPAQTQEELADWPGLPGFESETALCFQLLKTFMAQALVDELRLDDDVLAELRRLAQPEVVDLALLRQSEGGSEPRTHDEQVLAAMCGGADE